MAERLLDDLRDRLSRVERAVRALEHVLDLPSRVRVARSRPGGQRLVRGTTSRPCSTRAARRCSGRASSCRSPTRPTSARHSRGRTTSPTSCRTCRVPYDAFTPTHGDERVLDLDLRPRRRRDPSCGGIAENDGMADAADLVIVGYRLERRLRRSCMPPGRTRSAARRSSRSACGPVGARCPGSRSSACSPDISGIASTSRRVYGCADCRKSVPVGPSSTSRPPYMTATRSASVATTARSWLTYTAATPWAGAEVAHRLEHVRLRRHVEPGRRLVQDDHAGPVGERHRERDPLLLAARQLVRIAAQEHVVAREQHLAERLDDARAPLLVGRAEAVRRQRLVELRLDLQRRVQRGRGVLRDVRDELASELLALELTGAGGCLDPRCGPRLGRLVRRDACGRAPRGRPSSSRSPTRRRGRAPRPRRRGTRCRRRCPRARRSRSPPCRSTTSSACAAVFTRRPSCRARCRWPLERGRPRRGSSRS